MNHGITIEPVVPVVLGNVLGIGAISQVHTIDVKRHCSFKNFDHIIRLFLVDGCKVTSEDWVVFFFHMQISIENKFDRCEKQLESYFV
jgi:hypothetical protein